MSVFSPVTLRHCDPPPFFYVMYIYFVFQQHCNTTTPVITIHILSSNTASLRHPSFLYIVSVFFSYTATVRHYNSPYYILYVYIFSSDTMTLPTTPLSMNFYFWQWHCATTTWYVWYVYIFFSDTMAPLLTLDLYFSRQLCSHSTGSHRRWKVVNKLWPKA